MAKKTAKKIVQTTPAQTELAYKVHISVEYDCIVFVKPGEDLDDRISDIDIPENTQCKYHDCSMGVFGKNHQHLPDYDHLTVEQKDTIRTKAIENYAEWDGGLASRRGDSVPGIDEARELFGNATIAECLISFSGGERTLLDFDPETGKIWED